MGFKAELTGKTKTANQAYKEDDMGMPKEPRKKIQCENYKKDWYIDFLLAR